MKNYLLSGAAIVLLLAFGAWYSQSAGTNDVHVISSSGLHWHPKLKIIVKGQQIEIPQNIGVGMTYQGRRGYGQGGMAMTPIHTHDDVPIIHLEFEGRVTDDDLKLGHFFTIWGKDIRSFGENMHMTVNGVENLDYENYVMQNDDMIELHYE